MIVESCTFHRKGTPLIELEIKDHIATLTMNNPKNHNALGMEMREKLGEFLLDIEVNPDVRCVVLKGAGKHFMSGGDVKKFVELVDEKTKPELRTEFMGRVHKLNHIMMALRRMPKPIIASVQGGAAGAGVSMALSCDMVIASEKAFFVLAYCHIGTSPDGAATFQLPRTIGLKKTMEMALLGERMTAEEAKDIGMINRVVPHEDLEKETHKLAKRLASGPTIALGNTKQLIYKSLENEFESQIQLEAELFADSATKQDFAEGVNAFKDKRPPQFRGF